MKILLAEDDKNISLIAKLTLENVGHHSVVTVDNGADALIKANTESFDLILLDEMMPKMNGLKVCEEIRKNLSNKTPIIFLSAKSQNDDIELFQKMGNGFIAKPFDPIKLCQQIEDLLGSAS